MKEQGRMETFFKAKEMLQSCSKAPTGPAPLPPATCHPRSRGTNHRLPLTHAPGAPTTSYLSPAPGAPTSHPHSRGYSSPGAPTTGYLSPTLQGHQAPAIFWQHVVQPYGMVYRCNKSLPLSLVSPLRSCLHLCQITSVHKNRHFAFWIICIYMCVNSQLASKLPVLTLTHAYN